jgi:cell division transport system permease protein
MRALGYFLSEAAASLWRGRRAAALAVMTIAAGLFLLGFFLIVNLNLARLMARWSEAAELSVYLRDDIEPSERAAIEAQLAESPIVRHYEYVSKEQALARFRQDFADLAGLMDAFQENPLPASYEVRLHPEKAGDDGVSEFAARLARADGVADVRYDRLWLARLSLAVALLRAVSLAVITIVGIAAALTVANVVRLAAYARRDEIEIMQLVGAPLAYVRGPFVTEGVLQGGAGAVVALGLLWAAYTVAVARYGRAVTAALGLDALSFLPPALVAGLVLGGMAVGCVGGIVAARGVR